MRITILPGDGIGPEVTTEAVKVLEAVAAAFSHDLRLTHGSIGGAALREYGTPLPNETLEACFASDAVLLGAVGAPEFDDRPTSLRPEAGLLRLRRELGAFANLRPARLLPSLEASSPLKPEVVKGTDMLIVRELLGGLYFGEPRSVEGNEGVRVGINTMSYTEEQIVRVTRVAFELARLRRRHVTSVDKANVLECSWLWRDVVTAVAAEYLDVTLVHQYVDSCAMAMVARPSSFDVILTENTFGDILSDEAGAIVGSLGLLASASIGGRVGLYEPVHGSAPDIAGKGIANPLGAILSVAMLLRHTFKLESEAACVERALEETLASGHRTPDIARPGAPLARTAEIAREVVNRIEGAQK
ncbi:MAG TPA: 3-isopropylmalate dehydrogenase [Blastocatellia bacterium]|nr:3-isopropylmalate dehydrogenase [Blastocatellia bacterium]